MSAALNQDMLAKVVAQGTPVGGGSMVPPVSSIQSQLGSFTPQAPKGAPPLSFSPSYVSPMTEYRRGLLSKE